MRQSCVAYYRLSTAEQGRSGLGLGAAAVNHYVAGTGCERVGENEDVESGRRDDRTQLHKAIAHAERCKGLLIIAKFDRLSRKPWFVTSLMEAAVKFVAIDNP